MRGRHSFCTTAKLDLEWTDLHAPQLLFTQVISYCMELLQARKPC
jgi:hypothetical protein